MVNMVNDGAKVALTLKSCFFTLKPRGLAVSSIFAMISAAGCTDVKLDLRFLTCNNAISCWELPNPISCFFLFVLIATNTCNIYVCTYVQTYIHTRMHSMHVLSSQCTNCIPPLFRIVLTDLDHWRKIWAQTHSGSMVWILWAPSTQPQSAPSTGKE